MEVRFVGSGDAFGSGGRFQTCIRLQHEAFTVLVDCGATSLTAMKAQQLDPGEVDAVVISHLHGDHFGGLPFLVLDGHFTRRTKPLTVFGPAGTAQRLIAAMETFDLQHIAGAGDDGARSSRSAGGVPMTSRRSMVSGAIWCSSSRASSQLASMPHPSVKGARGADTPHPTPGPQRRLGVVPLWPCHDRRAPGHSFVTVRPPPVTAGWPGRQAAEDGGAAVYPNPWRHA